MNHPATLRSRSTEPPFRVRLFPLPEHVLLPDTTMPYRVFEPRYKQLVQDLLDLEEWERWIAIPKLLGAVGGDGDQPPAFEVIATMARVEDISEEEDGTYHMVVHGVERVRLHEIPSTRLYRTALVELCPDRESLSTPEAYRSFETLLQVVTSLGVYLDDSLEQVLGAIDPALDISARVNRLASLFLTNPDWRQQFLENRRLDRRIALLQDVLTATLALALGASETNALPS